ncbi:MAG TPA: metallopeptidase TldD-related protein [Phycisphaerae bacterium]|nr:metallopeptidase TldD-related protein [Phycisphaerae bacterium]
MNCQLLRGFVVIVTLVAVRASSAVAAEEKLPDSTVLMRAMVDELARSMKLQMEDLEQPYFVQFAVDDLIAYRIAGEFGAITSSQHSRSRRFNCQVRVGSMELDNTNFSEGGGGFGGGGRGRMAMGRLSALPLDDDYMAIRQAIWRAADDDYKEAVETLTRKRAYLKSKNVADRPNDFSSVKAVEHIGSTAVLNFHRAEWEKNVQRVSAQFKKYKQVQDSGVQLTVGAGNSYVVNSEGTRMRVPDTRVLLTVTAEVQAEDGMRLSSRRTYAGQTTTDLPSIDKILKNIDDLVAELTATAAASILERYNGPVMFDDMASAQLFQALLADGLAGRPDPIGESSRGAAQRASLENKLGTVILPKSFQVWDDPSLARFEGRSLLGHYEYDDEGVAAERVDLVKDGKLEKLCMSRTPVKKLSGSNGHGRIAAGGDPRACCASLFIKDKNGVAADKLKEALIEAAKDAGLEYGVRVRSLASARGFTSPGEGRGRRRGMRPREGDAAGGEAVGEPVVAYKVFVSDGHEEPFRGCQFGAVDLKELRRIIAAGDTPYVYHHTGGGLRGGGAAGTILAPPVVFEELELSKIEEEHDKPPILKAPAARSQEPA